jgi:hypothetical protein
MRLLPGIEFALRRWQQQIESAFFFNEKGTAVKLKEITPAEFVCSSCAACPAVFETENDSYVVIGKKLGAEAQAQLAGRVADDEFVIEVPRGMIDRLK